MPIHQATVNKGSGIPSQKGMGLCRLWPNRTTMHLIMISFVIGIYTWLYVDQYVTTTGQETVLKIPLPTGAKLITKENNSKTNVVITAAPAPSATTQTVAVDTTQTVGDETLSLTNPTYAARSAFHIKNVQAANYSVCDVLELLIEVRDRANVRKKYGGDVMWPYIQTAKVRASAPADELIDHQNGSYTARFTLTWAGVVEPLVRFVYSAEHARGLRDIRKRFPNRFAYDGKFTANGTTEVTPCHISRAMPFIGTRSIAQKLMSYSSEAETCDFSDVKAGTQWYCLKPTTLPCSAYAAHVGDITRGAEYTKQFVREKDKSIYRGPTYLSNSGALKSIQVSSKGQKTDTCLKLPKCTPGLPPKPPRLAAGYYYNDSWESKVCQARAFNLPDTLQCLRGKSLYFYGDSTIRQWFEYLVTHLGPTMKEVNFKPGSARNVGPRYGSDPAHNITLFYRHHEFPIRNVWTEAQNIKFTVNEVDALPGGPDTIVAFTYWAHFTPTNLTYYKMRLTNVKAAVERLHRRGLNPSPVIFKSANTRGYTGIDMSDLYAYDLDQVMRALFIGVPNVSIVDVWDMTLSHRTGYRVHPVTEVIKEEIKMYLNVVCKTK